MAACQRPRLKNAEVIPRLSQFTSPEPRPQTFDLRGITAHYVATTSPNPMPYIHAYTMISTG